jgi:Zn-dependent peptidase ImmA (M78 family)/DNA-binding XRE family transcriptional regulator
MVDVPVNGAVLAWARKERGLSEQEAAKRLDLTVQALADLETGNKKPSLKQLDLIALKYQIPFASLMMPEPLPFIPRPADFRTHGGKPPIWDEQLLMGLEAVNQQVETFAEIRQHDPDLFTAPAIRNYARTRSAREVAEEERRIFGISIDAQFDWPTPPQAFRYWRHQVERAGIFVQILDLGPESLCRGFTIFDERGIPAAVINGQDAEGPARTFTLFHEYAHLLIREPGVSDQNRSNKTEQWCNEFAAYFLMPETRFKHEALAISPGRDWMSDTVLRKIADLFKVSMSAVALHLENTGLAKAGLYDQKREEWKKRKPGKPFAQMSYPERQVQRLGVRHVGVVLDAVDRSDINTLDAYELMNVDPRFFGELKKEVEERQKTYGGVR